MPYSEIINFAHNKKITLSPRRIKKLLKKGVKSKKNLFKWVLSSVAKAMGKAIEFVAVGLGNVFFNNIPNAINTIKSKEKHWNPAIEDYNPILIPSGFLEYLEKIKKDENYDIKILKKFIKPFFNNVELIEIGTKKQLKIVRGLVPNRVYRKLKKAVDYIFNNIKNLEEEIYSFKDDFIDLILNSLETANAFLCGLYNSLIDIINGIFQVIGIVFLGISELVDFNSNIGYYASYSIEVIENIIESIYKTDFKELFTQFLILPFKLSKFVYEYAKNAIDINIQEIFYFLGYIVGFVIETIISILFTGGTLTLNKVLIKTFKEPFELLLKGIKKIGQVGISLFEKIIQFLQYSFKKLENVKELFLKFYQWLDEIILSSRASNILERGISFYTDFTLGIFRTLKLLHKKHWIHKLNKIGLKQYVENNIYTFVYKDKEIFKGSLKQATEELKNYFKNARSSEKRLERYLDEVAELIVKRKKALANFITKYGDELLQELTKHWDGKIKYKRKLDKFGNPFFKKQGIGGHNYQAVLEGKMKIIGDTIPANPKLDEPFIAKVQMFDETNIGSYVNKSNSTIKINGKQNRKATSMFPKNWDTLRIKQETAFAEKNMKFLYKKIGDSNELIEGFVGKSTNGIKIELIFNDGILITTTPIIKTK